jgi:hypothetical protein
MLRERTQGNIRDFIKFNFLTLTPILCGKVQTFANDINKKKIVIKKNVKEIREIVSTIQIKIFCRPVC